MLDNQSASGTPEDSSGIEQQTDKTTEDKVAYETYKKTVGQVKKSKEQITELEGGLKQANQVIADFKAKAEAEQRDKDRIKEESLLKQGKVEKVLELKRQEWEAKEAQLIAERDKAISLMNETDETLEKATKMQAFFEGLPGKLIDKDYLLHANLDNIIVDEKTGKIDEESVQSEVNRFMEKHSKLVDTKSFKSLPGYAPNGKTPFVTGENFKDLPLKDMTATMPDAVKRERQKLGI